MSNCTFIFSRHCGLGIHNSKPTGFVAGTLKPLLEERVTIGKRVHIIHDIVPNLPMTPDLVKNFERLTGISRFIRDLKQFDKGWRLEVKASLAQMDSGCECELTTHLPETKVILETNLRRPQTVLNHLGFYPLDSVEEATRFRLNMLLAEEKAKEDKLEEAVEYVMQAHNALAARNLHSDIELIKQIAMIGEDVIVLRSMNNAYLVNLDKYDIAIAESVGVINFADLVRKRGISIYPSVEETPLTFGERAVNRICSGGIDKDAHRELTLLEIFFANHMTTNGLWDSPGGIDQGLKEATTHYEECFGSKQEHRQSAILA